MPNPTILLVTQPDAGQSNVQLALVNELLHLSQSSGSSLSLHLAADPENGKFQRRVAALFSAKQVRFHPLSDRHIPSPNEDSFAWFRHGPTTRDTWWYREVCGMIGGQKERHVQMVEEVMALIEDLKPDMVVCDQLAIYGIDACRTKKQKFVVLSPLFMSDVFLVPYQPWLQWLWRYPLPWTGLPFPLPVSNIFCNIRAFLTMAYYIFTSPHIPALRKARSASGIPGPLPTPLPLVDGFPFDAELFICASFREADLPLSRLPTNGMEVGPMVIEDSSVSRDDEGPLSSWLDEAKQEGREVVLICLGTGVHFPRATGEVAGIARAARTICSSFSSRVLWKLSNLQSNLDVINETFGDLAFVSFSEAGIGGESKDEWKGKETWVTDWIAESMPTIYSHPAVTTFVHHAGANSYLEGLKYGLKHIALPQWWDCYNSAVRIEYTGVGVWANRSSAPLVNERELVTAMEVVMQDKENKFGSSVSKMKEACETTGGARSAAEKVVELVTSIATSRDETN
ncbi:glycosyltransferase family 1 protein [Atractiella rhizophila]|nr:glycosyltransferase family 1 protein [Atractiella rhizophila]